MKVAVVGSGSIGLYYGAKLARAGGDVHFLMRSGLEEARNQGIKIECETAGVDVLHPVNAHGDTSTIGTVDLVVVAIKATQNRILPDLLPPLLGKGTSIITLQNGLGNEEFLAEHFGRDRVMGALCFVCLTRSSPAAVRHVGHGTISIGEAFGPPQERTHRLHKRLEESGLEARIVESLEGERWRKLVWNIPFNGLSVALGGLTVDRLLASSAIEREIRELMGEVIAIAGAQGFTIPAEFIEDQIARTRKMGPYQPSTMIDYLAHRELEIRPIWEIPLERAKEKTIGSPRLRELHDRLVSISKES